MKKTARTVTTLVVAVFAVLAMTGTAALAQVYPPGPDYGVTCPNTGPGETLTCTVVGAQPGEVLAWSVTRPNGQVIATGQVTANDDGEAQFSAEIPDGVMGRLIVTVTGPQSGTTTTGVQSIPPQARGEDRGQQVAGVPGTPTLPMTGGEVAVLLTVGLALIGGGLFALRRREDAKVSARA